MERVACCVLRVACCSASMLGVVAVECWQAHKTTVVSLSGDLTPAIVAPHDQAGMDCVVVAEAGNKRLSLFSVTTGEFLRHIGAEVGKVRQKSSVPPSPSQCVCGG